MDKIREAVGSFMGNKDSAPTQPSLHDAGDHHDIAKKALKLETERAQKRMDQAQDMQKRLAGTGSALAHPSALGVAKQAEMLQQQANDRYAVHSGQLKKGSSESAGWHPSPMSMPDSSLQKSDVNVKDTNINEMQGRDNADSFLERAGNWAQQKMDQAFDVQEKNTGRRDDLTDPTALHLAGQAQDVQSSAGEAFKDLKSKEQSARLFDDPSAKWALDQKLNQAQEKLSDLSRSH